ncbi:hypothetical protein F5884DRAFT_748745 [Xylogone sp. PMI_703]|nr:hypothetical protein F5884DRAFT_748745 [Xylogone sp. PMI_703]
MAAPTKLQGSEVAAISSLMDQAITNIQSARKIPGSIDDAQADLNQAYQAFQKVDSALPLIQDTLETLQRHILKSNPDKKTCQDIKADLELFKNNAIRLKEIFHEVIPEAETSRMKRYRKAAKGELVEDLTKQMLKHILYVLKIPAIKLASQDQLKTLEKTLKELSKIPRSLPEDENPFSFHNYGSGSQNIHTIHTSGGPQSNNLGAGCQFIGSKQDFQFGSGPPFQLAK